MRRPDEKRAVNDPGVTRVAVYIDFDNIVISRCDQVHGRGQFQRDKARGFDRADRPADPDIAEKLQRATVDVGAMIDFASSFGTLVLTRAYADWSAPRERRLTVGSSSAAQWTWCSSFPPPPTPRMVPTSGWPWMRWRTCSGFPT